MVLICTYNYPRCSMYRIFTYIWAMFGRNVGKYSIHGAFGYSSWGLWSNLYVGGPHCMYRRDVSESWPLMDSDSYGINIMLIMIRSHWWDDWMSSLLVRIHVTVTHFEADRTVDFWILEVFGIWCSTCGTMWAPHGLHCGLISAI